MVIMPFNINSKTDNKKVIFMSLSTVQQTCVTCTPRSYNS